MQVTRWESNSLVVQNEPSMFVNHYATARRLFLQSLFVAQDNTGHTVSIELIGRVGGAELVNHYTTVSCFLFPWLS